jgi:adenosylmethionine-8-amino-7-oxononanoate aminotransferase
MQHHEQIPLVSLARGQGAWLFDHEGRRLLDAVSSWWVNLFGHANPRINKALKQQLDQLEHAMLAGFTHEPVVLLSERLGALTENHLGHCFYASDGASAVEIALKMSFHFWRNQGQPEKREFVCLRGSYHGETLGALAVTDVALFRDAYGPLLGQAHVAMSPDARQSVPGGNVVQAALDEVEALFQQRSGRIASVIVEPLVQCATGMAMYEPAYLTGLRRLCDRYHVHLIADEIAVGCGRTGTFFACEQANIWPDYICLSKGISGGYLPLSLVMTTDEIYNAFYSNDITRGFLHSHSYTGNPLACRAALATLDIFEQDDVLRSNQITATKLTDALAPVKAHPQVKHFRRQGMIWAFDVDIQDAIRASDFSRDFFSVALLNGLLIRPLGTTVYLMPPYILNDAEIGFLANGVHAVLHQVLS